MENNTSKMVTLLGKIRKQMNGAVLDTFRYYGQNYGMNYGVAIHSLRDMANQVGMDDSLARFLYRQQVRELRIIALWIADSATITAADFDFWAAGIVNSEVAEQAAQALLCRIDAIDALLEAWCNADNELLAYCALLAAARSKGVNEGVVERVVKSVIARFSDNHLTAQGAVALLSSLIATNREFVKSLTAALPDTPTASVVREEIAWRIEY